MSTSGTTIITAPASAPIPPTEPANPLGEFKSVEELAAAYQALAAKSVTPVAPPVGAQGGTDAAGSEAPKETTEGGESAAAALEQRGLNIQEFSTEFAEKGELSPESYEKLAKSGIPQDIVDSYIEGQKLRGEAQSSALLSQLSTDRNTFDAARQWAASNLSPEQLQVYNGLVAKGGLEARMAVNDLLIQYGKANPVSPSEPARITGQRTAATVTGYSSIREMAADQAKPAYKTDPAFRAQVEARARASSF
jgi:hypothetical protein